MQSKLAYNSIHMNEIHLEISINKISQIYI